MEFSISLKKKILKKSLFFTGHISRKTKEVNEKLSWEEHCFDFSVFEIPDVRLLFTKKNHLILKDKKQNWFIKFIIFLKIETKQKNF